MSRVWKRFLLTIAKYVAILAAGITWFFISSAIVMYSGVSEKLQGPFFILVCLIAPAAVYFLRNVFVDIKAEVEREDKELLRKIKG